MSDELQHDPLHPLAVPAADSTAGRVRRRAVILVAVAIMALGGSAAYAATRATAASIGTGVVVIETNLAYQDAAAAGTGIVLTSSGEILTNNHVIEGATTIRVKVPNTNRSYAASVLGYSKTGDIALIKLTNASNLKTSSLSSSTKLTVGTHVTAVGNAGGTGRLVSATGTVTALGTSITVQGDDGSSHRLIGLIKTNAPLQPGDSGGPLLNGSAKVVGVDTAASTASPYAGYGSTEGFAIPIATAMKIAEQIAAGQSSSSVHIGDTAFLGVQVGTPPGYGYGYGDASGATIVGVVPGGPADKAGLVAGDVITAVGGTQVDSADALGPIVLQLPTGRSVTIDYVDANGDSQTTTVTPGSGPPQ